MGTARRKTGKLSAARTERFEARMTPDQKAVIAEAAALDNESVTHFVMRAALRRARRRLVEEETMRLTVRDRAALVAALEAPPKPSKALQKAFRNYRETFGK